MLKLTKNIRNGYVYFSGYSFLKYARPGYFKKQEKHPSGLNEGGFFNF